VNGDSSKDPVALDHQANQRLPEAKRALPKIEQAARINLLIGVGMVVIGGTALDGGDLLRRALLVFGITSLGFSVAVVIRAVRPVRRIGRIALWSALFGIGSISLWAIANRPHAHDRRNWAICARNMRVIGQAIFTYAQANGGCFPNSLDRLADGKLDMDVFVCPATEDTPSPSTAPAQQAADLTSGGHLSYIYCGKGLQTSVDPETVLLWEWPARHLDRGGNSLFGDGHVETLAPEEIADLQVGINPPRRMSSRNVAQPNR
jgi:prepilin-type processing-associated H-X9-DG protein